MNVPNGLTEHLMQFILKEQYAIKCLVAHMHPAMTLEINKTIRGRLDAHLEPFFQEVKPQ